MKKLIITICIMQLVNIEFIYAQCDAWTQKADFGGIPRSMATSFSIGSKGYIGTGADAIAVYKDFWEYDPSSNTWMQKADFGGIARYGAVGFSINGKGYIGTGYDGVFPSGNNIQDFWEYYPDSNIWTQKANFGGSARRLGVGFSIGSKGYIGTGWDGGFTQDFWEYYPDSNTWTQKANFGGSSRYRAVGFSIGSKGYLGTGANGGDKRDFWEYDTLSNTWAQMTDFGGTARDLAVGFSIGSKGYIGTGDDGIYKQDFWEYDPDSNIWSQKVNFGGTARGSGVGFSINSKGYLGTGNGGTFKQDFWEYIPSPPAITSDTSANIAGCNGDSTGTISINAIGTSILYYSIDGGLTFSDTSNFTGLGAGSYDLIVQDANGCTDTGITIIITEPPAINFDTITSTPDTNNTGVGTATVSVSGGTKPYTYLWTPSGQTDSTAIGLIIGMYIIDIQDSNDCSYEDSVYIDNITGIIDIDNINNHIMFYPNPTNDMLYISFDRFDSKEIDLKIIDILGKTMYENRKINTKKSSNKFIIVTGIEKGLYYIVIHTDKLTLTQKLIIQ